MKQIFTLSCLCLLMMKGQAKQFFTAAHGITAATHATLQQDGITPARLLQFNGSLQNGKATLQWTVGTNELYQYFEVQRSTDGTTYRPAALVFSTDKAAEEHYALKEKASKAFVYYRIRFVHKDMTESFSEPLLVKNIQPAAPNTVQVTSVANGVAITYQATAVGKGNLIIYNADGEPVYTTPVSSVKGKNRITVGAQAALRTGTFIIEITHAGERSTTKFIKQ